MIDGSVGLKGCLPLPRLQLFSTECHVPLSPLLFCLLIDVLQQSVKSFALEKRLQHPIRACSVATVPVGIERDFTEVELEC